MNIPFTGLYFASYETAKRATMKHANCEESLLIQGLAGACSSVYPSLLATYIDSSAGTKIWQCLAGARLLVAEVLRPLSGLQV